VTLIWFVVWLVADLVGNAAPLRFDPVNWWAGTLLFVVALDLSRQHAPRRSRR
jgi:hypothetical protein